MLVPSFAPPEFSGDHFRVRPGCPLGAHAVISTPRGMETFARTCERAPSVIPWLELYMSRQVAYRYRRQLCYQLFEDTASRRLCLPRWTQALVRIFAVDKRAEPLWSFSYRLDETIHSAVLVLVVLGALVLGVKLARGFGAA